MVDDLLFSYVSGKVSLAAALYAIAFLMGILNAFKFSTFDIKHIRVPMFFAWMIHTFILISLSIKQEYLPLANSYQLLFFVAWMFVSADFVIGLILKIKLMGFFASLPAALLLMLVLLCPEFDKSFYAPAPNSGFLVIIHSLIAVISYAGIWLTGLFGLMYLVQNRSLKIKKTGMFYQAILPLPRLNAFLRSSMGATILVMTVAIMLGMLSIRTDGKILFLLLMTLPTLNLFLLLSLVFFLAVKNKIQTLALARSSVYISVLSLIFFVSIAWSLHIMKG